MDFHPVEDIIVQYDDAIDNNSLQIDSQPKIDYKNIRQKRRGTKNKKIKIDDEEGGDHKTYECSGMMDKECEIKESKSVALKKVEFEAVSPSKLAYEIMARS